MRYPVAGLSAAALLALALVGPASPAGAADPPAAAAAPATPAPRPAAGLVWRDVPNDAGRAVELDWEPSADDRRGDPVVRGYQIERSLNPGGPWTVVDSVAAGVTSFSDQTLLRGIEYFYRVIAAGPGGRTPAGSVTGPVVATSQWFNGTRWSVLVLTMLFFGFVLYYIASAQSGKKPFVRRIPGIDAIEEAIGRATEMGRSVLYVPGIQDIDEIQTVQALIILESVARLTAKYETPLKVPVTYPIPFAIAEEMVRGGYLHAGRPDRYDPDSVQFVSPEQFAYVASITGIMMRDQPAAHIFMGSFFAESLLLAETGFATGAIQVAGTANVHQLPFFVVACDYTLIGEELYAASAYLSGEPKLVGSLKGADLMKIVLVAIILAGCVLESFGVHELTRWMITQ
ncbi:MAG: fibronectin type III domain-containing protein [Candidatus Eisenbacteria bacterium]|nr:fibronectin type III domain-containing protein [Candidatus Eisenbacteria bacterium]